MNNSVWDDIEDSEFFNINEFDSVYNQANEALLFRRGDLTEAISRTRRARQEMMMRIDGVFNIYRLRSYCTTARETCEALAQTYRVTWNSRSWKGWAMERRAYDRARRRIVREWDRNSVVYHAESREIAYRLRLEIHQMYINLEQRIKHVRRNNG